MADLAPLKTPLHHWHQAHGGRIVEFGGWLMPVQYSTIVEEHTAVRSGWGCSTSATWAGSRSTGPGMLDWLERVTTNHVGQAQARPDPVQPDGQRAGRPDRRYPGLSPPVRLLRGLQRLEPARTWSPSSSATGQGAEGNFHDRTADTAMIAVQGPSALATVQPLFNQPLEPVKYYHLTMGLLLGDVTAVVSRTGYTGEDGLRADRGSRQGRARVWNALLDSGRSHGIAPCGLGARDTLRFEAAMPLYGHELSDSINPYAAGVGWAVKLDKGEFVGREALRALEKIAGAGQDRPPPRGQADRPPGHARARRRAAGGHGHLRHLRPDPPVQPGHGAGRPGPCRRRHGSCRPCPRPPRARPMWSNCRSTGEDRPPVPRPSCLLDHSNHSSRSPRQRNFSSWTPRRFATLLPTNGCILTATTATVGISRFAVDQLTDLIMIELPSVGTHLAAGKSFGEVESVKAVSDLYAPSAAR